MSIIPSAISITDLRKQSAYFLANLPKEKLYLLLQNSKPKGVLVDLEYLQMLQEAYEDYLDILAYDKAIDEPKISWQRYKQRSRKKVQ